ncbi:hypothetical protein [Breznakiella homolactica]|uniref:Uracil DNA glycosylase superfamily protein n=1 Tax=Breznakiella homolactica TaxID=2798577 RepID=A0A7T7XNV4_9SPIR|nr:hypothetical protein [Breznakiella homolactica]QQO09776.1 hypothetical protein JFL75_02370 [Breznakiella homolactica]
MTESAWKAFRAAKRRYRNYTVKLAAALPELEAAQVKLIAARSGGTYPLETPLVYNGALDDVGPGDDIKIILVADNPGKKEQAAENRRYLVGPSGKIADRFFKNNPSLGIDFRRNVIILNKTPIHTPRTAELKDLAALGGPRIMEAIKTSQVTMAESLYEFHRALAPAAVWIIGYSEMKKNGIFDVYTDTLQKLYHPGEPLRKSVFLYRHFSMNQFTVDFNRQHNPGETAKKTLQRIGKAYRERILHW